MKAQSLSELRKLYADKKKELDAINSQISDRLRKTLVACENCQRGFPIRELQYIQTFWFDKGLGYDDDQWHPGDAYWVCPTCTGVNTIKDPDIVELKRHFKSITDEKVKP